MIGRATYSGAEPRRLGESLSGSQDHGGRQPSMFAAMTRRIAGHHIADLERAERPPSAISHQHARFGDQTEPTVQVAASHADEDGRLAGARPLTLDRVEGFAHRDPNLGPEGRRGDEADLA